MSAITQTMHAASFESMIFRRGRQVAWREATMCSCWREESGQPLYTCQACKGFGFIYGNPVTSIALVTNLTVGKDFSQPIGGLEFGDATLTVPAMLPQLTKTDEEVSRERVDFVNNPMYDIGLFDLVALTDDEIKFSEVLIRGIPVGGRAPDTLSQDAITRIKTVQKSDSTTGTITPYVEGTDFQLNGNTIEWIGTNAPAQGEAYSVTYYHHPTYYVFTELPKPRYQDGQFMPRSVAIRLRMGGITR